MELLDLNRLSFSFPSTTPALSVLIFINWNFTFIDPIQQIPGLNKNEAKLTNIIEKYFISFSKITFIWLINVVILD